MKISNKDLTKIWKQVPVDYYDVATSKNLFQKLWHERRFRVLKRLLDKDAKAVLDLGCATGHFTVRIDKHLKKAKVTGVDVYKPFVDYLKKKYPKIECFLADAHDLPFENKSFDTVVVSEVLDHVVKPKKVLSEVRRVLRPGGSMIVSLDELSLAFRILWFFWIRVNPGRVWQGAHLHHFDEKSFEKLLRKSGFTIEKRDSGFLGMIRFYKARK